MPRQGVTSTFSFGESFGWCQGILDAYGVSYELVRPLKWKREFSVTGDKNSSIAVCKRLFPDVSLKRTENCRKDDDNLAESLLLCEYARRKL
jgi:crossover junction endodeoxyribonuclease RuvC